MTQINPGQPDRRVTYGDIFAVREYQALWLAEVLSEAGDQLARVALSVLVFDRTGSALLTGVAYAMTYLPWAVGGPLTAGLADRLPRRTLMIICDVVRALMVVGGDPGIDGVLGNSRGLERRNVAEEIIAKVKGATT